MAAYAALLSLRQILEAVLDPPSLIMHNTAQLRILLEETGFFLNFLDDSSTYTESQLSALETKMRDAAHKAEDLIEYGILDRIKSYMKSLIIWLLYFIIAESLTGRVGIQFFLAEVVLCAICSFGFYLYFPEIYVSRR